MLRRNTGRFLDSLGAKKMSIPMIGSKVAPRGATMRMVARKCWRDALEESRVDMERDQGREYMRRGIYNHRHQHMWTGHVCMRVHLAISLASSAFFDTVKFIPLWHRHEFI